MGEQLIEKAKKAKEASLVLGMLETEEKNKALLAMADALGCHIGRQCFRY
jgi:gamma-glutamyl phosphate reductase